MDFLSAVHHAGPAAGRRPRTGSLEPGTEPNTLRYRVTRVEAGITRGDSGPETRIRVDVENTGSRPMEVSRVDRTSRLVLEPGSRVLRRPTGMIHAQRASSCVADRCPGRVDGRSAECDAREGGA